MKEVVYNQIIDGKICITEGTNYKKLRYYKEVENELFKGYIVVEGCYHIPKKKYFIYHAYLDLQGKNSFLAEQKHYPWRIYVDNIEELIPETQNAIQWLENYFNSDWLSKKPKVKQEAAIYYKHDVAEWQNEKYIRLVNRDLAKYYLLDEYVEGNEIYKLA